MRLSHPYDWTGANTAQSTREHPAGCREKLVVGGALHIPAEGKVEGSVGDVLESILKRDARRAVFLGMWALHLGLGQRTHVRAGTCCGTESLPDHLVSPFSSIGSRPLPSVVGGHGSPTVCLEHLEMCCREVAQSLAEWHCPVGILLMCTHCKMALDDDDDNLRCCYHCLKECCCGFCIYTLKLYLYQG